MFRRKRSTDDFAEEIRSHLDLEADDLKGEGLNDNDARRQARSEFGSVDAARERFYAKDRVVWLDTLLRDIRYGMRGLLRSPGFTAVAVLTLALGIGANAAIFSLLDQALLRALPVLDPGRLVVLSFAGSHPGHTHSDGGNSPGHQHEFTYPMYEDLRDQNTVLSGLITSAAADAGVSWNDRAEAVQAEMVSGNYFQVLGVQPALGRLFVAGDETAEGANPVAVLNFDYWRTHLAQGQVEGKTLLVNGTPFTIVGVAAPGFHSMVWGRMPEIYVPITMQATVLPDWTYLKERQSYWIDLAGRLKPGVTAAQAEAEMNTLYLSVRRTEFTQLHDQSEKSRKAFLDAAHLNLEAGAQGFSPMRDDVRTPLTIVMGMVVLVIGMAVVNVASLLLVRAANRAREFSIRYALGATSVQILRQLLIEGTLLGLLGAALGLAIAPRALEALTRWMRGQSPDEQIFSSALDWRVLVFTLATTVLASLLFSLAPAVQFWNPKLAEALRQQSSAGRGGSLKFRRTCVALQIGFGLLLIIAAGLFVRTIENLRNVDPGFATDHLLAFDLAPEMAGYVPAAIAPVEQRVIDAVSALPGVRAVGATNDSDLTGDERRGDVIVPGYTPKPDEEYDIELPWVSNSYLQTLNVPLVAGRYFTPADTAASDRVSIVNESFARHYFGSAQAAVGRHVSRPRKATTDTTIVGVVRDVKHSSVRDPSIATFYTLFAQAEKPTSLRYYVRTWQEPKTAANGIRAAVEDIDPKLVVSNVTTLSEQIDENLSGERTISQLAMTFGLLAVVLAGVGLYGILAYSTAQRTREIGIRMAMGARQASVVGLIVREVLVLAGAAIAATIPLALVGSYAVRSQLFGVSIADPRAYGGGVLLICLVAALAGWIPARRAASINPTEALRSE